MIHNAITLLVLAAAVLLHSCPRPPPPAPPPSPRPPTPPPRPPPPTPPTPPAAATATHGMWPVQLGMFDKAWVYGHDFAERIIMEHEMAVTPKLPSVSFPTNAESAIMPDFIWELCKPLERAAVALTSPERILLIPSADELDRGTLYSRPGGHKSAFKSAEYLYLEEIAAQLNGFAKGVQSAYTVELNCCAPEGAAGYTDPARIATLPAAGEHQRWQKTATAYTQPEIPEPAMEEIIAQLNCIAKGVQSAYPVELCSCAPEGAAGYTDPTRIATLPAAGEHQRWQKEDTASTQRELPEPAIEEIAAQLNGIAKGVQSAYTFELSCCAPEGAAGSVDPTRAAKLPAAGEHQRWQKAATISTHTELPTLALEGKALLWVVTCFLTASPRSTGRNTGPQPTADTLLLQDTMADIQIVVPGPAVSVYSGELLWPNKQDCKQ